MATTEDGRLRNAKYYRQRVNEHRCANCGKQDERTLQGRVYCQSCYEKRKARRAKPTPEQREMERQNKRDWYNLCKSHQMCVRCGTKDKRTVNGHTTCVMCAAKANKRRKESYDSAVVCARDKARREMWREQGLCTCCGRKKEEPNKAMCIDCRVAARLRSAARKRKATGNVERSGS